MPRQLTLSFGEDAPGHTPEDKERGTEQTVRETVHRIAAEFKPRVLDACTQPPLDAADIKGNELAKRQLLVAAAGNHQVAIAGPDDEVARFLKVVESFHVPRTDQFKILITRRETVSARTGVPSGRHLIGGYSPRERADGQADRPPPRR